MERDFTAKCYHQFCSFIEPITDKYWRGVLSWLNGHNPFLLPSLSEQLPNWGDTLGQVAEIELYYKDLLERYHATKESIKEIFESISTLDRSFSNIGDGHFGSSRKQADAIGQYIKALTQVAFAGTTPPVRFCGLANYFSPTSVNIIMEKSLFQLQFQSYIQKLSATQPPQFTASTFFQLSEQEKNDYVRLCADLCPELAEKLDAVFFDPDWTEQEKLDIKFLIYSSPEPYRSVYLQQLCRYNVQLFLPGDRDGSGYYPISHIIYMQHSDDKLINNVRGPYTSLFHEFGHFVDDFAKDEDSLSRSYEFNGQNIYDSIFADVRTYLSNYIDSICKENSIELSPDDKERLLLSLNISTGSENDTDKSVQTDPEQSVVDVSDNAELYEIRCKVQDDLKVRLSKGINSAADDMYGSVTNNQIIGSSGHREWDYWYNEDGTPKKMQNKELWAEFFAAQMTHNEDVLASMREYFPTTFPLLEEMALNVASK